jgi:hypothetical protein
MFSDLRGKVREATECVSVPGDQFTPASFDTRQGSKTIDLQFEDKLIRIKWLYAAGKPYGT